MQFTIKGKEFSSLLHQEQYQKLKKLWTDLGNESTFETLFFDDEKNNLLKGGYAVWLRHAINSLDYKLSLCVNKKQDQRFQLIHSPLCIEEKKPMILSEDNFVPLSPLQKYLQKITVGKLSYRGSVITDRYQVESDTFFMKIEANKYEDLARDWRLKFSAKRGHEKYAQQFFLTALETNDVTFTRPTSYYENLAIFKHIY